MRVEFRKTGILVLAGTGITVLFRVGLLPLLGQDIWKYAVVYAFVVAGFGVWLWQKNQHKGRKLRPVVGHSARPVGLMATATGVVILAKEAWNLWRALRGSLPEPAPQAIGGLDRVLAIAAILLGLLAGVCFVMLGLKWSHGPKKELLEQKPWLLLPALWLCARLARYIMSYAFATHLRVALFEYAALALSLLMVFLLGRRSADKGSTDNGLMYAVTQISAVASLSGVISRYGYLLIHSEKVAHVVFVMCVEDLFLGIFACVLLWYWDQVPASGGSIADSPTTEPGASSSGGEAYHPSTNGDNGF